MRDLNIHHYFLYQATQNYLNDSAAIYYFLLDNFVEGDTWVDIMFDIFAPLEKMSFKQGANQKSLEISLG